MTSSDRTGTKQMWKEKVDFTWMFDFVRPSHVKCRWMEEDPGTTTRRRGARSPLGEAAFAWPARHVHRPLKHSDKLLAGHDKGFLNYPSCTMKYVVNATCRIKQHSKTTASQILILQLVWRVGPPSPQTFFNVCDSAASVRRNSFFF